jgi:hypothetical protein
LFQKRDFALEFLRYDIVGALFGVVVPKTVDLMISKFGRYWGASSGRSRDAQLGKAYC